ncbi:MAG TPA: carbohydrate-binding family 9-like protein [Chryseolinea sp.]|nr:carbohydrate-binding family 9-like protein [Chryseolinea sp.]
MSTLFTSLLLISVMISAQVKTTSYTVHRIHSSITLTGKGDDALWKSAPLLSDFSYPWENGIPPSTRFKALHDDDWLYCLFEVEDSRIHVLTDKNEKWEVASSDRVEIFFRTDQRLTPYYCLEIDPTGRVLDYEATFHRKFNIAWSWPVKQLVIKTAAIKDGYVVEIAISKASLQQLGILNGSSIEAGLYRAECTQAEDPQAHMRWISWIKPDSPTPDFHIASSFGILSLSE